MSNNPQRGELWLVDLGYVAKIRPCLVLNIPIDDRDRAISTIIPHTTMQIKDLTIDEFRQLIKTCIRETVEEIIDDRLDDDPDTINPQLRDRLLA